MSFEFHPDARDEFIDAAVFYDSRQVGLGDRFADSVGHGIQQILADPRRWRVFEQDVRRYLTSVFPYAILYTIEPGDRVLIVAVMHCSREPNYWRHRLN